MMKYIIWNAKPNSDFGDCVQILLFCGSVYVFWGTKTIS